MNLKNKKIKQDRLNAILLPDRRWLMALALFLMIFVTTSCYPVVQPSITTGETTSTESVTSATSNPVSSSTDETTDSATSDDTSTETSSESSADESTETETVEFTTQSNYTSREATTRSATTTPASTRTTTTASRPTPTNAPTPTNTPTPTQPPPAADRFPYKNYGAFFRDDYGRSSQVIEAQNGQVKLNTGSTGNGVVLVQASSSLIGSKELIVVISANGKSYQYTVPDRDRYAGIPLNMGNGTYAIQIIEATPVPRAGGGYDLAGSILMSQSFSVSLSSSLKPYTAASVKNDFSRGSSFVQKANELASGKTSTDGKVSAIYTWIVNNISYDAILAKKVNDANLNNEYITHIANPATTYSTRKGICDDYAALMSAMLRSQGIPTRIIYGHVTLGSEKLYHAWNEVYFAGSGWVVVASFSWKEIDGSGWVRFDSTFAASGSSPESIRDRNPPREKIY